jgi:uncharacterized protein YkwD
MGQARIVENKGSGFYTAVPLYDWSRVDRALNDLQAQQANYATLLLRALETREALRADVSIAADALNAAMEAWNQGLLNKLAKLGPLDPPTPTDPETSYPWTHPDRGQEPGVLTAVNAARAAAEVDPVSRVTALNRAALSHLRDQASSGKTGHFGSLGQTPFDRVLIQGYSAAKVSELLAYGPTTPDELMTRWNRGNNAALLLDPTVTECGIAYHYAEDHPAAHLWCVLLCVPGEPPPHIQFPDDPKKKKDAAQDAAEQKEKALQKIKPPRTDPLTPSQMTSLVENYATAQQKLGAAERELTRLMAERLERDRRIAELERLKTQFENRALEVWACTYNTSLSAGDVVNTAELPGFWRDTAHSQLVTVDPNTVQQRQVVFDERAWNIIPTPAKRSMLSFATVLSPELVFANLAMEPGHLRWKPAWRYGIITDIHGEAADVTLNNETERGPTEIPLNLNQGESLAAVPIDYRPCGAAAFEEGDEVLISFTDFDWAKPSIIGFRRAPRYCWHRISWAQFT